MKRVWWFVVGVALVVLGLSVLVGSASAQTSKLEDATGNGHDFMQCDPDAVAENFTKFGPGIEGPPTVGGDCRGFGSEFTETQSRSWMFAVNHTEDAADTHIASGKDGDGDLLWRLILDLPDDKIRVSYEDTAIGQNIESCNLQFSSDLPNGRALSFWVQITPGDALTDTVVEAAWFNGTGHVEDASCTIAQEPETVADADSFFHIEEFDNLDAYFEIRFWDTLPSQAKLDRIADPTDSFATLEVEGSEEAVWFLEPVPAENIEEDIIPGLAMSVPERPLSSELFHVRVWAQNSILDPVKIQRPPNVTLARSTSAGGLEWWNQSSEMVEVSRVDHQASRIQPGAIVWQVTFEDVPASDWVISVRARANSTAGQEVNLTASHPMTVTQPETNVSVLSDTAFHDFSGLTSLEWALFFGASFLGAVLWSRSLDPVVESFGAVLPVLAGLLLLGFGNSEGLGSIWTGTVAMSAIMILAGVYMVVRLFVDKFAGTGEARSR